MTVTLDLSPEVEARLLAESSAKGLPVSEIIKGYVSMPTPEPLSGRQTAADVLKLLNEAADLIPTDVPPLSDHALSRQGIYEHEENWNR